MHKEIATILKCPVCNHPEMGLVQKDPSNQNIIDGLIFCPVCKQEFHINNGVADLLYNLPKSAMDEIEATKKEIENRVSDEKAQKKLKKYEHLDFGEMSFTNFYGIRNYVKDGHDKMALDLGTGGGWLAAFLSREGYVSAGIDLCDTTFVDDYGKEFSLILTDWSKLPFKDEAFDLVASSSAIHHSDDLVKIFSEISRILKNGGKTMIINEPVSALLRPRKDYGHERESGANEHCYSLFSYIRAIKKAGFKPKIYFPAYIEKKLIDKNTVNLPFGKLAKIFSIFFKNRFLSSFTKYILKYPMYLILGPQLVLIAEKPINKS